MQVSRGRAMSSRVDDYVEDFFGWQGQVASMLRREILAADPEVTEDFRWGHPVFSGGGGPICFFKVLGDYLTLAFWRGQQMMELEPRFSPTGSYRMADVRITGPDVIEPEQVQRLVRQAVILNRRLGDPLAEKAA